MEVGLRKREITETLTGFEVLEALAEWVVVLDRDWKAAYANQAAISEAGRDITGTSFWDSYPCFAGSALELECRRAMTKKARVHFNFHEVASNRWLEIQAFPIGAGIGVSLRDITASKEAEFALRQQFESEIASLNESFAERVKERTEELEAANQEMEGFTYSVSHDLRAPLRAIMSTSMILLEDSKGSLSPDAKELLKRQAAAAKKMGVLIDELLKLSRLARQEMALESLDLSLLAQDVALELQNEGRSGKVCFKVEPKLAGKGDARLLRFVLLNLMENASKFSPGGGTVTFGKSGEAFYVKDEGVGFDMNYVHKVFLPFERLVTASEYPGTGIGLANVQRIVQRHGGRVWAKSELGKGSTFFFTLA